MIAQSKVIDPVRYYEINGQVYPLLSVPKVVATGNNQTVIAAISGKVILVMGWICFSTDNATDAVFTLKDGSGGTSYLTLQGPMYSKVPERMTPGDIALMRTTVGVGLFADVSFHEVYANIFYLAYTP